MKPRESGRQSSLSRLGLINSKQSHNYRLTCEHSQKNRHIYGEEQVGQIFHESSEQEANHSARSEPAQPADTVNLSMQYL